MLVQVWCIYHIVSYLYPIFLHRWSMEMMEVGERERCWPRAVPSRQGRGTSSSAIAPPPYDRDSHQQYIENERLQQLGHTIQFGGCPHTPLHLTEFDDSYMRNINDEFTFCAPNAQLHILWWTIPRARKEQRKAREMDPYATQRIMGIYYIFLECLSFQLLCHFHPH
jgi:hypothetical protein